MPVLPFDPIALPVTEASQVGDARRSAVALAAAVGFDERARGEVALVVTEAATNLARHTTGGELVFRSLHAPVDAAPGHDDEAGFEMLAIDRGPGMANWSDALRDGHTSSTTPGTGLGAIARRSDTFAAFTRAPAGTVILSRVWPRAAPPPARPLGVVCLPLRGEVGCGDAWHVEPLPDGRARVLVADGLGHGLRAAEAARLAVRLFREHLHLDLPGIVAALHAGLRATRGAAVSVAEVPAAAGTLRFVGVGNVAAAIVAAADGKPRGLVAHNGTAGVEARRIQEFLYPWQPGDRLVMHSDGLASQWQLTAYPGLRFAHPAVIAGVLYRDFRRHRDDVTVLVLGGDATAAAGGAP